MKTIHKKTQSGNWRANKFGYYPVTIKKMMSFFKFNQPKQNQEIKSYANIGFIRIEREDALKNEIETSRIQGRIYANITPIR